MITFHDLFTKIKLQGAIMKKYYLFIIIISIMIIFCCKTNNKYSEVKKVMQDITSLHNKLSDDLDNVKEGKDFAKAMTHYVTNINILMPKYREFEKTFPEIMRQNDKYPKELKDIAEKYTEATNVLSKLFGNYTNYAKDPDVQAAMEEFYKLK